MTERYKGGDIPSLNGKHSRKHGDKIDVLYTHNIPAQNAQPLKMNSKLRLHTHKQ